LRLWRSALHLDEAHAAVAGDRQPLMEAETRHFGPGHLRRLQQRVVIGNLDLLAVDLQSSHLASTPRNPLHPSWASKAPKSSTAGEPARLPRPVVARDAAGEAELVVEPRDLGRAERRDL